MILRSAVTIFVFTVSTSLASELAAAPITMIVEGMLMATGSDEISLDGAHMRVVYNVDDQMTPSRTVSTPTFEQVFFYSLPVEIEITNRPNDALDLSLQKVSQELLLENGHAISSLGDFVHSIIEFDDEPFLNGSEFSFRPHFEFRPLDVFPGTAPPELAQLVGVQSSFLNVVGAGDSGYDINANFSAVSGVPEPNSLVAAGSLSLVGLIGRIARRRRQVSSVPASSTRCAPRDEI